MPRDMCPHYSGATSADGVSRCRACGVVMYASPVSAIPNKAEYPGKAAAAGTALNAAKSGGSKIDGGHH